MSMYTTIPPSEIDGYRDFDEEATAVNEYIVNNKAYFDEKDIKECAKIKQIINKHSSRLFDEYTNLEIVSGSPVLSRYTKKDFLWMWCIVLYCKEKGKIPKDDTLFPKWIESCPVDVRQGYFCQSGKTNNELCKSTDFQQTLSVGAEIMVQGAQTGSLGGFIRIGPNVVGALTCGHVCGNTNALDDGITIDGSFPSRDLKPRVYQPAMHSACGHALGNEIGHVERVSFLHGKRNEVSVDAALILITNQDRKPKDGLFVKTEERNLRRAGMYA